MPRTVLQPLRSSALVAATVLLGISWSFALLRVHTVAYPLLWAGAMPLLAFYYFSAEKRPGVWKHLPAGALAIYTVVLWQVARGYGVAGGAATILAVAASFGVVWFLVNSARHCRPILSAPTPGTA